MTVHGLAASPVAPAQCCSGCVADSTRVAVHIHERTVWGQRMLYREAGSPGNPTVLLLHGMTTTAWNITHLLHALAPDFHVIAPDHVGAGLLPARTPTTAEHAVATMSAHLDALIRLLGITHMAVLAQDIAAHIAQDALEAGGRNRTVWAVAFEELPGGTDLAAAAHRSPFGPAIHTLLVAAGLATASGTHPLRRRGDVPAVTFQAQPDSAPSRDPVARSYRTDLEGTPVDHEVCKLAAWLRTFLLRHAPSPTLVRDFIGSPAARKG
jgi:pimeloyl-ACP methyl ester carboxylesterase